MVCGIIEVGDKNYGTKGFVYFKNQGEEEMNILVSVNQKYVNQLKNILSRKDQLKNSRKH